VVELIQTWALQIATKSALLRPVTIALKVIAAAVCILATSYFLPVGALGPAEAFARRMLPWGGMFFFLFLGMYGLMRGLQELRSSGLAGVATLMVYGAAFVGSYMVAISSVMPSLKGGSASVGAAALGFNGAEGIGDAELLAGDPDAVLEALGDAGVAEDGIEDRRFAGGSEEADLESIRAMQDARKNNSARLNNLQGKIPSLAK
jgi:hypothetical protein